MYIEINPSSGVPIYLQVKNQVKRMIAANILNPDEMLPSVRQMAIDLKVNPNTIAKAYREMEIEKTLYTRRGTGVFVSPREGHKVLVPKQDKVKAIMPVIDQLIVESYHNGLKKKEVVDVLDKRFEKYDKIETGGKHE